MKQRKNYANSHRITLPYELTPAHVKILSSDKLPISKELQNKLINYAKNIESSNKDDRISAKKILSAQGGRFFMGQGSVFTRFILQNRKAIQQLVSNLGNATILIAPERGGGLVLDHIKNALPYGIQSIKVPKFPEEIIDQWQTYEALYELSQYPWSKMFKKVVYRKIPKYPEALSSGHEQSQLLKSAIQAEIEKGHKTIALVDTMIVGTSARKLIKIAEETLAQHPEVQFNILIHQDTICEDKYYGHKSVYRIPLKGSVIPVSQRSKLHIRSITSNVNNVNKLNFSRRKEFKKAKRELRTC